LPLRLVKREMCASSEPRLDLSQIYMEMIQDLLNPTADNLVSSAGPDVGGFQPCRTVSLLRSDALRLVALRELVAGKLAKVALLRALSVFAVVHTRCAHASAFPRLAILHVIPQT
jgi:hypothetical protein